METIRAFIALDLSDEARAVLATVSAELAQRVPDRSVRWVEPERIHLTLRFLGNTPLIKLADIYDRLDEVARDHDPFLLSLGRLGCFPSERRPRVIWVGVEGDTEAAAALNSDIESVLVPLGWESERRPFQPHLTLGRVKDNRARIELPWGKGVAPAATAIDEVCFYESKLHHSGSVYTVRHRSQLGARAA
jgi:2'-5' RNA ligase